PLCHHASEAAISTNRELFLEVLARLRMSNLAGLHCSLRRKARNRSFRRGEVLARFLRSGACNEHVHIPWVQSSSIGDQTSVRPAKRMCNKGRGQFDKKGLK